MTVIETATAADGEAVLGVASTIGFEPVELDELRSLFNSYTAGEASSGERWYVVRDTEKVVAVAYVAPERMTSRAWNLLLLAVHSDHQRRGLGASMLDHVERSLSESGERLLLIETSATEDLAPARALYRNRGYEEEARIRDYYDAGDDKVVFRKQLAVV